MSILTSIFAGGTGTLLQGVDKIVGDFKANPTQVDQMQADLKTLLIKHQETMESLSNDALGTVNTTIQTEAKSEHWMQWAWRPCFGFMTCATIANNYIVMPYFSNIKPITIPENVWMVMLTVLGVAAATRGGDKNLLPDISFGGKK